MNKSLPVVFGLREVQVFSEVVAGQRQSWLVHSLRVQQQRQWLVLWLGTEDLGQVPGVF